jgi:hypothetical protein
MDKITHGDMVVYMKLKSKLAHLVRKLGIDGDGADVDDDVAIALLKTIDPRKEEPLS